MKKSYTIIELIMVIVIVGILAAISIPRFQSFYYIKLNGAVKKIVSDIRYVQQFALSKHADSRIEFNTGTNSYQACFCNESDGSCSTGSCGSANWTAITNPFTRGNLQVNFNSDAQYGGIDVSSANFGGGNPTLIFDWQGIPRNGAGTALSAEGSVIFSYQNNVMTIYITPNTGRVRMQ